MLLHKSIIWSTASEEGISGIEITCDYKIKDKVKSLFEETFTEKWNNLLNQVEEEDGDCLEKDEEIDPIMSISDTEKGILISLDSLAIHSNGGDSIATVSGDEALKATLKELKEEYPSISYDGYIGYYYYTDSCGEVVQYEISSSDTPKKNRVHDFVGEQLAYLTYDDDEFWANMEEQLEDCGKKDFIEVFKCFTAYSKWLEEDVFDKLLEIAENVDDDIRETLEEKIDNWKEKNM